jgi:3-oxoacyl-[acyl-carrier-protein] synthase III
MGKRKAVIKAISTHLPQQKLTNAQLAQDYPDWEIDKIFDKTGIAVRGIAAPHECASDLGVLAAQKIFDRRICAPKEIDFLLFCTQSPDYFLPTTACLMQERLHLNTTCGALDFNLGCSGFVYGLSLAKGLIESGIVSNLLLITADTYSKFINLKDRSVRTIFGDGAAAVLISAVETGEEGIGPFIFGTDGQGAQSLMVPAGGLRMPVSPLTAVEHDDGTGNLRSLQNLFMDGPEIFNFSLKTVPQAIDQLLGKCGMSLDQIDYFVFHQANRYMLESLRRKIKIPQEKFCINLESYGNTVSATIPMALEIAMEQGKIKQGDSVMLLGFGVGYSWAGTIVRFIV